MKNILTIFKKEFARVMKDPRLIITVLILPGLMIYVMYSLMGGLMTGKATEAQEHQANILVANMPEELKVIVDETIINDKKYNGIFTPITVEEINEENKNKLKTQEVDLILYFEDNFYSAAIDGGKPKYQVYFNSFATNSGMAYDAFLQYFTNFENKIRADKGIDIYVVEQLTPQNIFDDVKESGKGFSMLLPFLIMIFLFAGAMSIGPESIAGEKERGTIATLLITPIKRSEIAIGKILSISALASISAVSSFIGVLGSIPKLMGEQNVNQNIYGAYEYMLILLLLVTTVLLIVGLICIVSAFAKSVKEATMYVMPLYAMGMIIGISQMFNEKAATDMVPYFIPIYNTAISLSSIFLLDINPINIIICILTNVVFAIFLVYVLTRMFNNEKVMFSR